MKLVPTALPEVLIVEPRVFGDERGFFLESWNAAQFAEAGLGRDRVSVIESPIGMLRAMRLSLSCVLRLCGRRIRGSAIPSSDIE